MVKTATIFIALCLPVLPQKISLVPGSDQTGQNNANPQYIKDVIGIGSTTTVLKGNGNGSATAAIQNTDYLLPYNQTLLSTYSGLVKSAMSVVIFGDSVTDGQGASPTSNGYAYQLRNKLQSLRGDGGSGLIPISKSTAWSLTGTWTAFPYYGPYQTGVSSYASVRYATGTGNTAQLSAQTFNAVDVYCMTNVDTATGIDVKIDGVSQGTACGSVTPGPQFVKQTFATTLGSHTVLITAPSGNPGYLLGAGVRNSLISQYAVVHNFGTPGARSEAFGFSASTQLGMISVLPENPNLAIIMVGINDAQQSISVANYTQYLTSSIQYLQSYCPVMVVAENPMNGSGVANYPAIIEAAKSVASSTGAAFYSVYDAWSGSYTLANSYGLMADSLHPGNDGHSVIANELYTLLTPHYPPQSVFNNPLTSIQASGTSYSSYWSFNGSRNASTTLLNGGMLLYSASNGTFGYGMDMGYSGGKFSTRAFFATSGKFALSTTSTTIAPTGQSSFTDIFTVDGSTSAVSASGTITAGGRVASSTSAASDLSNYWRPNNNRIVNTSGQFMSGLLLYDASNGTSPYGIDLGYIGSKFTTRLIASESGRFSFAKSSASVAPTAQTDLIDIFSVDAATGNTTVTGFLQTTGSVLPASDNGTSIGSGSFRYSGAYFYPTTPSTSSSPCSVGFVQYDVNYMYVCTATNTWKRSALSAF